MYIKRATHYVKQVGAELVGVRVYGVRVSGDVKFRNHIHDERLLHAAAAGVSH